MTKKRLKCYVAGPYSSDPEENTAMAIDYAEAISQLGYIPYIPHLTHHWEKRHTHPYKFWMDQGIEWLCVCDILFRMPGKSEGADDEVAFAKRHNIPVYYNVFDLPNNKTP